MAAKRTHDERDIYEDRLYEQNERRFERVEDKLDKNTIISQKALDEATLTNSRVTHLEDEVKVNLAEAHRVSNKSLEVAKTSLARADRVHERLVDMEKVIVPDKPPEPEDLPKLWQDSLIRRIVIITVCIVVLAAIGFSNEDIRKLFGG